MKLFFLSLLGSSSGVYNSLFSLLVPDPEAVAAIPPAREALFTLLDANRDGCITEDEWVSISQKQIRNLLLRMYDLLDETDLKNEALDFHIEFERGEAKQPNPKDAADVVPADAWRMGMEWLRGAFSQMVDLRKNTNLKRSDLQKYITNVLLKSEGIMKARKELFDEILLAGTENNIIRHREAAKDDSVFCADESWKAFWDTPQWKKFRPESAGRRPGPQKGRTGKRRREGKGSELPSKRADIGRPARGEL